MSEAARHLVKRGTFLTVVLLLISYYSTVYVSNVVRGERSLVLTQTNRAKQITWTHSLFVKLPLPLEALHVE